MSLDLVALAIVAVFVLLGALRGGLSGAIGLAAIGCGYAAAVVGATGALPGRLAERGVPGLLATPVAGTVGFLLAYAAVAAVGFVLQRIARARRGEEPRSRGDRAFGAAFGALRGLLVVLLLSVLATWLEAAHELGIWEPGGMPVPHTGDSLIAGASGQILGSMVEAAAGGEHSRTGKLMGRIAANPSPALKDLQAVIDDPDFQALQQDRFFWTLVENGASERAMNGSSFHRIVRDAELRRRLADLGLVSEAAAEDTAVLRREVAEMLDALGPRLKALREDPELARLAQDPEVMGMIDAGDTLGLLMHPGIQRLVNRFSDEGAGES